MKNIMKYISENAAMLMKEASMLAGIAKVQRVLPVIIIALFLLGAYITSRTPSKATLPEGFVSIESDALEAQKLRNTAAASAKAPVVEKDGMEGFETGATATGGGGDFAAAGGELGERPLRRPTCLLR
jgi:hypothetical protein